MSPERGGERAAHWLAQGIDLNGGLRRAMGRPDLFARMLRNFGTGARELPAQLEAQPDTAAAATLHGFRGLCATLGLARLAERVGQGEQRLRQGLALDAGWRRALYAEIAHCLAQIEILVAELEPLVRMPSAPGGLDKAAALHELRELIALLDNADMAALDMLEALRRRHGSGLSLDALDEAMAGLDFELARTCCENIIGELIA